MSFFNQKFSKYLSVNGLFGNDTDNFSDSSSLDVSLVNIGVLEHAGISELVRNFRAPFMVTSAGNVGELSVGFTKEIFGLHSGNETSIAFDDKKMAKWGVLPGISPWGLGLSLDSPSPKVLGRKLGRLGREKRMESTQCNQGWRGWFSWSQTLCGEKIWIGFILYI